MDSNSSNKNVVLSNLLGSATAGLIGRSICHPLDTAKSRLQSLEYHNYSSTYSILRDTYRQEGFKGLFRGYGAVTIGGIPGVCIYLTVYEMAKEKMLAQYDKISPFLVYFMSGIIAEAACCVVFVPVDVIKERLQVQRVSPTGGPSLQPNFQYKGSFDAAQQIMRTEGFRGVYRGYGATLLSYSPFSAIYFLLYEQTKKTVTRPGEEISFIKALLSSAFSGVIASYITSPLDMAKLRLQIQRMPVRELASISASTSTIKYTGFIDVLRKVYKVEGIRGLFRGAGARVFFHTPSTAITMGIFEECKRFWGKTLS